MGDVVGSLSSQEVIPPPPQAQQAWFDVLPSFSNDSPYNSQLPSVVLKDTNKMLKYLGDSISHEVSINEQVTYL